MLSSYSGTHVAAGDGAATRRATEHGWALSKAMVPLKRSVMRELMQVIARPGVQSLAAGLPAADLLPAAALRRCMDETLAKYGAQALQYGPPLYDLQAWIAGYMQGRGVACQPEQIVITNGAQQGLAILSRLLLDAGDPAVIEAVTFTGIQQVTAGRGARVRLAPTDLATGIDVDALEQVFRQRPRPRFAVLIPDFHNPLGVSMPVAKRQEVAQLAARYGVPVIEDDPYSPLRFEGAMPPPIKAFDEAGLVLYVGSFSKMVAPALRLGWIVAPPELLPKITVLRESLDLESSALMQRAAVRFLQQGHLESHLQRFNAANRQRRDALLATLQGELGDIATWTLPEGGLFVWVTLPAGVDTWRLLTPCVDAGMAYVPGAAFAVAGDHRHTLRLNFSSPDPEQMPAAIATLAAVIRSHLNGNRRAH